MRRALNPSTMDYDLERGAPRIDTTHASDIVRRLATHRGSSSVAPQFGSRLHLIDREAVGCKERAVFYAKEALADLMVRGAITNVQISASVITAETGAFIETNVAFEDENGSNQSVTYRGQSGI